jgi:hypothetical protein
LWAKARGSSSLLGRTKQSEIAKNQSQRPLAPNRHSEPDRAVQDQAQDQALLRRALAPVGFLKDALAASHDQVVFP